MTTAPSLTVNFVAMIAACLAASACATATSKSSHAGDADAIAAVRATELQRLQATVAVDLPALRRIYSPQLRYCHSTAVCESGTSLLARLETGKLKYLSLQPLDLQIEATGSVVLVHGSFDVKVDNAGQSVAARQIYLAIYERAGSAWQLRAYQSTRVP
jgi:ketosteroid isomerase-like protein